MKRTNPKNSLVWIIKEQMIRNGMTSAPMDYSSAMQYGDLEFVTQWDIPMHGKGQLLENWKADVNRFVVEFNPAIDFVIPTGQPLAILSIGYLLGCHGKFPRFLVWRREENRYQVLQFNPELSSFKKVPDLQTEHRV
jgi:hypothetical protein